MTWQEDERIELPEEERRLERALREARPYADAQSRATVLAQASAARAWQVAYCIGPRLREPDK